MKIKAFGLLAASGLLAACLLGALPAKADETGNNDTANMQQSDDTQYDNDMMSADEDEDTATQASQNTGDHDSEDDDDY